MGLIHGKKNKKKKKKRKNSKKEGKNVDWLLAQ
jgi:hypothetical protein